MKKLWKNEMFRLGFYWLLLVFLITIGLGAYIMPKRSYLVTQPVKVVTLDGYEQGTATVVDKFTAEDCGDVTREKAMFNYFCFNVDLGDGLVVSTAVDRHTYDNTLIGDKVSIVKQ